MSLCDSLQDSHITSRLSIGKLNVHNETLHLQFQFHKKKHFVFRSLAQYKVKEDSRQDERKRCVDVVIWFVAFKTRDVELERENNGKGKGKRKKNAENIWNSRVSSSVESRFIFFKVHSFRSISQPKLLCMFIFIAYMNPRNTQNIKARCDKLRRICANLMLFFWLLLVWNC